MAISKVQLKRGNTAKNDAYLGQDGELTVDLEAGTMRRHDGVTPGGHVIGATAGDDPTGTPGPTTLAEGDSTLGYFGLVPAADLITGDALAAEIGLSAGRAHNADAGWFKYVRNGRVCFGARQTLRYDLSWDDINAVQAVHPGDGATVTLGGVEYYVRLFEGGNADPTHDSTGYDPQAGVGSEWNQVFYRLTDDANSSNVLDSERPFTQWGSYSDAELGMVSGNGRRSWTQEVHGGSSSNRVNRGRTGVSNLHWYTSSYTHSYYGWRPVLEPVNQ